MPVVLPSGRASELPVPARAYRRLPQDRNRLGRLLCGANCDISGGYDDIDLGFDQLGRIFRNSDQCDAHNRGNQS